ncbi:DUF4349 domain-containing protein [Oculatella sp. LEGE 06141]|uniref:DUF4349 domain-containing protein n=1 Tax=Oculatella sp. LEGE 06141 TaxID=1828648 RepID=UPI001880D66A|nr:DUF4349 domain-containing protein [Oculatella sp. LEGE 06141]MBE9181671.1 DUF4349 domain-containing protein [Oculatella sp. LEGE 06141]
MSRFTCFQFKPAVLASVLLAGVVVGCATPNAPTSSEVDGTVPSAPAAGNYADTTAESARQDTASVADMPKRQPQLVKSAELGVTVDSVKASLDRVTAIAQQQQGDILSLYDQIPTRYNAHHTAQVQLRVPQAKLDASLDALSSLGTVQRQTLTTEDVSNQLVDYQARLRNLRKTEEMLLEIMNRSGSVGDVLNVAQELSNVRSSIEQIDAQLNNLQNRVAFSTISLILQEAIAAPPPQRATDTQLQGTWKSATRSLGKVTVDLLQLGIWLMVYSPYWLLLAIAAFLLIKLKRQSRPRVNPEPPIANQ